MISPFKWWKRDLADWTTSKWKILRRQLNTSGRSSWGCQTSFSSQASNSRGLYNLSESSKCSTKDFRAKNLSKIWSSEKCGSDRRSTRRRSKEIFKVSKTGLGLLWKWVATSRFYFCSKTICPMSFMFLDTSDNTGWQCYSFFLRRWRWVHIFPWQTFRASKNICGLDHPWGECQIFSIKAKSLTKEWITVKCFTRVSSYLTNEYQSHQPEKKTETNTLAF